MAYPSLLAAYLPFLLPAGIVISALVVWWGALLPRLSIGLLMLSLVAGQTVRFPLPGQGGGILLSDIGVALVLISATAKLFQVIHLNKFQISNFKFQNKERFNHLDFGFWILALITPFLLWSLFTLIIHIFELGLGPALISLSYWLRLAMYLLLLPALLLLCREEKVRAFSNTAFLAALGALVVLGFTQLIFAPDFSALTSAGWDPHQLRLTSTWLDPNFFGAFLVMVLPVLVAWAVSGIKKNSGRLRITNYVLPITTVAALVFTQSRSSFVALLVAAALTGPLWIIGRRLSVAEVVRYVSGGGFFLVALVAAGLLLGDRFLNVVSYDPTVDLRAQSLRQVWSQLVEPHAFVGVGYNAYQFAALEAGLIGDFSIHSRAGADNSWLTIWVTTGVIGVVLFALPWAYLLHGLLTRWFKAGHEASLAGFFSLLALFVHSQFVNSFLYSHLLIVLVVIVVITLSDNKHTRGLVTSN